MTFKKQVIAVSEDGEMYLMSTREALGDHSAVIQTGLLYQNTTMPAGLYVVDILYLPDSKVDVDICYELCEYRDLDLYAGECKLT